MGRCTHSVSICNVGEDIILVCVFLFNLSSFIHCICFISIAITSGANHDVILAFYRFIRPQNLHSLPNIIHQK